MHDGIPFPHAPRELIRLGYAYDVCLGKMLQNVPEDPTDFEVPYLKAAHVQARGIVSVDELPTMFCNARELAKFAVREGDLLVCEGGEVGRAAIVMRVPAHCIIQNALHRVRSGSGSIAYLRYVLQHLAHAGWFSVLCNKATIAHLTQEKLEAIRLPLPAIAIQAQIATFLDRKTTAIDALIAKKERLIEMLQEKRQALITQAVTKGLDPNVPMKRSRSEWLGDIPAHWTTSQPKHLCSLIVDGPHVKPEYVDEGIPFVTVKNLTSGPRIDLTDLNYISHSLHAQLIRRGRPERGDVLLSKDGATLGVPRVVETDTVFSIFVSVALLKPRRDVLDPYFLRYTLEADPTWQQFKGSEAGSAIKHIVLGTIGNVRIALPPIEEQRLIGAKLALLDERGDKTRALVRRHIEKLREYRQALITAAVTGKIDLSKDPS